MKCKVRGCHSERHTRKDDGRVLEHCYKHAKEWAVGFEKAFINPALVRSLDEAVRNKKGVQSGGGS